jgi:hypothetical protein
MQVILLLLDRPCNGSAEQSGACRLDSVCTELVDDQIYYDLYMWIPILSYTMNGSIPFPWACRTLEWPLQQNFKADALCPFLICTFVLHSATTVSIVSFCPRRYHHVAAGKNTDPHSINKLDCKGKKKSRSHIPSVATSFTSFGLNLFTDGVS